MIFSFSGSSPFFIKCDGVFKDGLIDKDIRSFDLPFDTFIEVCFINGETENLLLDNPLLKSPPHFLSVTDLRGGFLLDFSHRKKDARFRVIKQQKTDEFFVTLFNENGLKLSVESVTGSFSDCLIEADGFCFSDCEIFIRRINDGAILALSLKGEKNCVYIYSVKDGLKKEGVFIADEYSFSEGFTLVQKKKDVLLHTVKSYFSLEEGLPLIKKDIEREKDFSDVSEKILPYAFLEELALGKTEYGVLSENIKENAEKLKNYLGEFLGVFPPPFFRDFDQIGLIKKRAENLYYTDYVTVEVVNRKITNVKLLNN